MNMKSNKKEFREALKSTIENLVVQEVRIQELARTHTPPFILEEMAVSIKESKEEIVRLAEPLAQRERASLIKRMIREAVEEEIERTIQQRGIPCLRCAHLRYYDWELEHHETFPTGAIRARAIGCDRLQAVSRVRCERFIESAGALSVVDYVDDINLLYEMREMFKKMKKIWEEYLLNS